MRYLVLLGLLGPFIALYSVSSDYVYGFDGVKRGLEVEALTKFLIVLCMFPTFLGSIMMLFKIRASILLYSGGWFIVCLSPLLVDSIKTLNGMWLYQFIFEMFIGFAVVCYFVINKRVKEYFAIDE